MEQEKEYFVFISYSSLDNEWAIWLRHELEHYHLPASFNGRTDVRDNLRKVFRDRDELSAGPEWDEQVSKALRETNNLIVICSPNAAKSDAVNKEVETFIALGKEDHIFPFIVEGNTPAECFPRSLSHSKLGGDVNKDGGRDIAFVKVVAGMLKVSFPSLWDRYEIEKAEEERRIREQRDKLLIAQSRFIAEKAITLTNQGNSYLAQKLLLDVLPTDLNEPNRPYVVEAEQALWYALNHSSSVFKEVNDGRRFVFFSSDGGRITSISDNFLVIYNTCSGEILTKSEYSDIEFLCKVENKDQIIIATCNSEKHQIKIIDINTGEEAMTLLGHKNRINSISLSVDGKYFVSASEDKSIRIWCVKSGKDLTKKIVGDNILFAQFSPNGKNVAYRCYNYIQIWEIEKGIEFKKIKCNYSFFCNRLVFSQDGKFLFAADTYKIYKWEVASGNLVSTFIGHTADIIFIALSMDGKYLISAGDSTIRIWDVAVSEKFANELKILGHEGNGEIAAISLSVDGKRLVSASSDSTIRIWDIETGKVYKNLKGHKDQVTYAELSSNGKRVVSASLDGDIRIWDIGVDNNMSKTLIGHTASVNCAKFSLDGKYIISAAGDICIDRLKDFSIRLWDANSGKELRKFLGHSGPVNSATFSTNGKRIVSASSDSTIRIWDIGTGHEIKKIEGHKGNIRSAIFTSDDKCIVSVSDDNTIRLWDPKSGKELLLIDTGEGIRNSVDSVSVSLDSKYIIAASYNNVRLWDAQSGKELRKFVGHHGCVNSATFSSDSTRIISASSDCTIRIWDIETGNELKKIEGHREKVNYAEYSKDGKRIVSASGDFSRRLNFDNSIRIWDAETGEELRKLSGHNQPITYACFSPNGGQIVSSSDDCTIRIWNVLHLQDIINMIMKNFQNVPLTENERREFFLL